jgi:BolA family transcriptional regulator, general stress-responsive regulator
MIIGEIRTKLTEAFVGANFSLEDESAHHDGHGAEGIHLSLRIQWSGFEGKRLLEQHRMVNHVLDDFLKSGRIHALHLETTE